MLFDGVDSIQAELYYIDGTHPTHHTKAGRG